MSAKDPESVVQYVKKNSHKIRKIKLYSTVKELATGLDSQDCTVALGGGGWLKTVEGVSRERAISVVPAEGALLWVECAAFLKNWPRSHKARLSQFLESLLSLEAQAEIADSQAYTGCTVVPMASRWEGDVNDAKKIFSSATCEHFRPGVYPRHSPQPLRHRRVSPLTATLSGSV